MYKSFAKVREYVHTAPYLLPTIKTHDINGYINSFMPFDVGIEIECHSANKYSSSDVDRAIIRAGAKSVNCSSDEKRFRITGGIAGMIALYNICEVLKEYCELNPSSGIHYHIDFTNYYSYIHEYYGRMNIDLRHLDWMLERVKHWNYTGTYNPWVVSYNKEAIRFHSEYKTIEFRIGEMTFDYSVMIKRIISAQSIVMDLINILEIMTTYNLKMKLSGSYDRMHPISATRQYFSLKRAGKARNCIETYA